MKVISHGRMYSRFAEGVIALVVLLGVMCCLFVCALIDKLWVLFLFLALLLCPLYLKPFIGTPYCKVIFDNTYSPKEIFEQYEVLQVKYPYYYIRDGDGK